jgi:exopolyphosphatase/guanosine-5'-triphosphate,3'-diphosphate pyrophosphatase
MDATVDDSASGPRRVLSVIDVGSSSVRMSCARIEADGSWTLLADEREMTRLASSAAGDQVLSAESMERSADAIARFAAIARGFGSVPIAVATAAVRSAKNQHVFLERVRSVAALELAVLSAHDEARAGFDAVVREADARTGPSVVIDIGGGSLQLTQALHAMVIDRASMPLGAVALSQRVQQAGPRDGESERREARSICEGLLRAHVKPRWAGTKRARTLHAFGVGGTFTTLLAMVAKKRGLAIDRRDPKQVALVGAISRDELRACIEQLAALPQARRDEVPGVSADRADILLCGLVAAEAALARVGASHVRVVAGGVREGLLSQQARGITLRSDPLHANAHTSLIAHAGAMLDAAAPHVPHAFAPHARHVAHLSLRLFGSLCELLAWGNIVGVGDGGEDETLLVSHQRALLHAGALVHDVGVMVQYRGHHKHGARIVRGGAWHGIASLDVELVALLTRYHRRAHPKERHDAFNRLPAAQRALLVRLASVLRVADGLDRTHNQLIEDVRVTREGTGLVVWAVPRGGHAHAGKVQAEVRAASDKAGLLEELVGCDIDVRV